MSVIFNELQIQAKITIINPIDTSYEIIWAAERNAPKKGYFEVLTQPAKIIPYTLKEDTANINDSSY